MGQQVIIPSILSKATGELQNSNQGSQAKPISGEKNQESGWKIVFSHLLIALLLEQMASTSLDAIDNVADPAFF